MAGDAVARNHSLSNCENVPSVRGALHTSVVIDGRTQEGLTREIAERAIKRAVGAVAEQNKLVKRVRVILPDGSVVDTDYRDKK
jgi:hypothetical protein